MGTVTEIIEAVKSLGSEEKVEFLTRLSEVDFDEAWDRQIAAEAQSGRLDPLWQQALEDINARRTITHKDKSYPSNRTASPVRTER